MKLLFLFALIALFTLASAKTGMCTGFGDVHMVTPWGRFNNQAVGTLQFSKTRYFKINVQASKWSRGTSVVTKVAIVAKACNRSGKLSKVLFDGSHFTVNNVKCSFSTAARTLKSRGVKLYRKTIQYGKGWHGKNRHITTRSGYILRSGNEFVELMSIGNNKRKRGIYSGHHIAVNAQGNHSKYGMCGRKTVRGHLFKRSFKIVHTHHYGKCIRAAHLKAEQKCRNIRNYWRRKGCVYDTCRGMSARASVQISHEIRKFQKYIKLWSKLRKHHSGKKAHFARLLRATSKRIAHHRRHARHHAKLTRAYHRASSSHSRRARISRRTYLHYKRLVLKYNRLYNAYKRSYHSHYRSYITYSRLCSKYSGLSRKYAASSRRYQYNARKYTNVVKTYKHKAYQALKVANRYRNYAKSSTRHARNHAKYASKYARYASSYRHRKNRSLSALRSAQGKMKYMVKQAKYAAKYAGIHARNYSTSARWAAHYRKQASKHSRHYRAHHRASVAHSHRHRSYRRSHSYHHRRAAAYARAARNGANKIRRLANSRKTVGVHKRTSRKVHQ